MTDECPPATNAAAIRGPLGPLLRRPEVERETGLSRSTIYARMEAGTFPRPLRLGPRAVRWPSTVIEAWKAEQPLCGPEK